MRRRLTSLAALAACAAISTVAPSVARAQAGTTAPVAEITPGTRVRFSDPWHGGATVEGQVTRRWGDSVVVHADGELAPDAYRLGDLRALAVSDGRATSGRSVARGALLGGLGGALVGGALLSFMRHTESGDRHSSRATDVTLGAAFGALAGALAGALHAPERWHAVSPR
jgi:hypothetical protein